MPRKKHIPHSENPYHVGARSHGGRWFHHDMDLVWNVMTDYLYFIHIAYEVKIHSFVLMSNHFHLLISTPEANLSKAMNYFMRETAKELNRISEKKNQVYGNRYHRTMIDKQLYYPSVYKYVYRNPVTAGISESCESYKYSTLFGLLGRGPQFIPMCEDKVLFSNDKVGNVLEWLNKSPDSESYETLKKSLQRKSFKIPANRWLTSDKKHGLSVGVF